jgi:Family of unknown function (DUF5689)
MRNIQKISLFVLLLGLGVVACTVEPNFDEPPTDVGTTTPTANTTIISLKALLTDINKPLVITDDLVVRGVVISDDRPGNFYKQLVIQDETGGLEIETYGTFLYTQFPIGREIAVRCKGLQLFQENGLTRLVGHSYEESGRFVAVGLTDAQIRTNIVKGPLATNPLQPRVVTINQLSDPALLNTLVQINNVQFIADDTSKTYAEVQPPSNVNRTLVDCSGNEMILRNSGYSAFANLPLPNGRGSVIAVVSTYRDDRQLLIRDYTDLKFDSTRCTSGGGGGGGNNCPSCLINEDFESTTVNQDIAVANWTNVAVVGTRKWRSAVFSNSKFSQFNPFGGPDAVSEAWLVTPSINATASRTLTFESSWGFYKHQGLTVWYCTNFDTAGAAGANWQPLTATFAQQSDVGSGNFSNWVPSGNVTLPSAPGGKIFVGFKYVGNNTTNTTSWRIDNVKVQ